MRKLLLTFLLVLSLAPTAQATITRPQAVVTAEGTIYATDGIETLTFGGATTAGDMVVACAGVTSSSRTLTVTDDRSGGSHTYSQAATHEQASQNEIWCYYTVTDAAVTNITFTLSASVASPGWASIVVFRASNGWDATPLGDSEVNLKTTGASPAQTAATGFTTTAASSVVVGVFMPIVNETWSDPVAQDSDTNNCTNIIRFNAGGAGGAAAYQILTNTETDYSFNFLYPTSGNAEGPLLIVEFQEAAAAAGCSTTLLGVGRCD